MSSSQAREKIQAYVQALQGFADRLWYPPLIGFLAALDNLILIIPNDGILISSAMLIPRRWILFSLSVAIGSTLGALALAGLVEFQGLPWILEVFPGLDQTRTWSLSQQFFDKYGLLLVFVVALTPVLQQPAVILASLASTPLMELAAVIFFGRLIKFLVMAYVGAHSPQLLKKLWGLEGELRDVGVKVK